MKKGPHFLLWAVQMIRVTVSQLCPEQLWVSKDPVQGVPLWGSKAMFQCCGPIKTKELFLIVGIT